jgi:hypothetical protein
MAQVAKRGGGPRIVRGKISLPGGTAQGRPAANPNSSDPIPLSAFMALVKRTPVEIWGVLLRINHGNQRLPVSGWMALIDHYGKQRA